MSLESKLGDQVREGELRIQELEAELADICKRLRGAPGPNGSRLDGENGLAAATMRAHDYYEAESKELTKLREEVREIAEQMRHDGGYGPWASFATRLKSAAKGEKP